MASQDARTKPRTSVTIYAKAVPLTNKKSRSQQFFQEEPFCGRGASLIPRGSLIIVGAAFGTHCGKPPESCSDGCNFRWTDGKVFTPTRPLGFGRPRVQPEISLVSLLSYTIYSESQQPPDLPPRQPPTFGCGDGCFPPQFARHHLCLFSPPNRVCFPTIFWKIRRPLMATQLVGRLYAVAAREVVGAPTLRDGGALLPPAGAASKPDQGAKSEVAAAAVRQLCLHVCQRHGADRSTIHAGAPPICSGLTTINR